MRILFVLTVVYFVYAQTNCPLPQLADTVYTFSDSSGNQVVFSLCGQLATGCSTPGGGQVCTGPRCCNICQLWNVGDANPGAACLGMLTNWAFVNNTIELYYFKGGDPVPPPGPPDPGPRQAIIKLFKGRENRLTNFSFIDGNQNHKPWETYTFEITANAPLDPCFSLEECNLCTSKQCIWCLSSNSCSSHQFLGSCSNWITNPDYCISPCLKYTNCKDCAGSTMCNWCYSPTNCTKDANSECEFNVKDPQYCRN